MLCKLPNFLCHFACRNQFIILRTNQGCRHPRIGTMKSPCWLLDKMIQFRGLICMFILMIMIWTITFGLCTVHLRMREPKIAPYGSVQSRGQGFPERSSHIDFKVSWMGWLNTLVQSNGSSWLVRSNRPNRSDRWVELSLFYAHLFCCQTELQIHTLPVFVPLCSLFIDVWLIQPTIWLLFPS